MALGPLTLSGIRIVGAGRNRVGESGPVGWQGKWEGLVAILGAIGLSAHPNTILVLYRVNNTPCRHLYLRTTQRACNSFSDSVVPGNTDLTAWQLIDSEVKAVTFARSSWLSVTATHRTRFTMLQFQNSWYAGGEIGGR